MNTLAGEVTHAEEIKKSRFICHAAPVESPEAAMAFLEKVRDPEATHNCWAYKIGDLYRFSDDGEPGGTAGRPILAAIEGQGLDRVMVVVTRYFGGIKLGAGGLVRAYGGVAAECLRRAEKCPIVRWVEVRVELPFEDLDALYQLLPRHRAEKLEEAYDARAHFRVRLPEDELSAFSASLRDATRGRARVEPVA